MATVADVLTYLDFVAPISTKMDFDNVGLLVGRADTVVNKIVVALDITDEVIAEAAENGAELIVSHHPLFFSLKNVSGTDFIGRKVLTLAENRISAICMHTNLDMAQCGVNKCLADAMGIKAPEFLIKEGINEYGQEYGLGMFGEIDHDTDFHEYMQYVKEILNAGGLRYVSSGKPVKKVAVLGGSGGSEIDEAIKAGCDTYITSDVKYDIFLKAREMGINLIDGGHFCTENVVVPQLKKLLKEKFPEIDVETSKVHMQTESFI